MTVAASSGVTVDAPRNLPQDWLSPTREGKRSHIQTVCDQYRAASGGTLLRPAQVLLVDDDRKNVQMARRFSTRAIWFQAGESELTCEHLLLRDILGQQWDKSHTQLGANIHTIEQQKKIFV